MKKKAEALEKDTGHDSEIDVRCDFGALFLQFVVLVASVSNLTRLRPCWLTSLGLGALGAVIGLSAYWFSFSGTTGSRQERK